MPKFTTFEEDKDALELILEHVLVDRGDLPEGEERDDLDKAITIIERIILSRVD